MTELQLASLRHCTVSLLVIGAGSPPTPLSLKSKDASAKATFIQLINQSLKSHCCYVGAKIEAKKRNINKIKIRA